MFKTLKYRVIAAHITVLAGIKPVRAFPNGASGPVIPLCRCWNRALARGAACSPKLRHQPPLTPGAKPTCSVHWSLPANATTVPSLVSMTGILLQLLQRLVNLVQGSMNLCQVQSKPETLFFSGHWIMVGAPAGRCASSRRRCARRRAPRSRSQRRCPRPRPRRPLRPPRWATHMTEALSLSPV